MSSEGWNASPVTLALQANALHLLEWQGAQSAHEIRSSKDAAPNPPVWLINLSMHMVQRRRKMPMLQLPSSPRI